MVAIVTQSKKGHLLHVLLTCGAKQVVALHHKCCFTLGLLPSSALLTEGSTAKQDQQGCVFFLANTEEHKKLFLLVSFAPSFRRSLIAFLLRDRRYSNKLLVQTSVRRAEEVRSTALQAMQRDCFAYCFARSAYHLVASDPSCYASPRPAIACVAPYADLGDA